MDGRFQHGFTFAKLKDTVFVEKTPNRGQKSLFTFQKKSIFLSGTFDASREYVINRINCEIVSFSAGKYFKIPFRKNPNTLNCPLFTFWTRFYKGFAEFSNINSRSQQTFVFYVSFLILCFNMVYLLRMHIRIRLNKLLQFLEQMKSKKL